jgi:Cu(I)/Ag(I) efflux system membrane fusion protein/cobalt-zinc-cadmium efflux system membrane fusion protein
LAGKGFWGAGLTGFCRTGRMLACQHFELRPDMYVNVTIKAETVRDVLTIPIDAVLNSGVRQTVFVALGEGKFEPRQIKTGLQSKDGLVEVRQGLLDGEEIVVSAQFMLDSESKLREAIQKMLEPKAPESVDGKGDDLDDLFADDTEDEELESLFEDEEGK